MDSPRVGQKRPREPAPDGLDDRPSIDTLFDDAATYIAANMYPPDADMCG